MQIERRTLYNLLRMNWLNDPSLLVEAWQVEDYRELPLESIFNRLREKGIYLDRVSFTAMAENLDTPEDLTDELVVDTEYDALAQDQIYLLVFEIWRRLVPEKLCLSVFCDELDYLINLYDRDELLDAEAIQDVLANLEIILHENTDQGENPHTVFESICLRCANDLESFLYDFITDQIDNKNFAYASELVDTFSQFVRDIKWFDFLHARVIANSDPAQSNLFIRDIVHDALESPDLEFNLEVLSFLAEEEKKELFIPLLKQTVPLLATEEEFQDLLNSYAEFLHRLDYEEEEKTLQKIIKKRAHIHPEAPLDRQSPHLAEVLKLLPK